MISFGEKYWFISLLAILLAAVGLAFMLYFKNKDNQALKKSQVSILAALRFLSFFLIAFLLLSPFLRNARKFVRNPVIIAAWDNSGSVTAIGDSAEIASRMTQIRKNVSDELEKDYRVIQYTFDQETQTEGSLDFSGKKSDYSRLISTISNNHLNDNIGAVVIMGDGIYNQGKNPVNMAGEVTFPVYSIGAGDTTEITDARIQKIRANRTSFSGNRFPVIIESHFSKMAGRALRLSVYKEEALQAETIITPPNNDYFYAQEFILEAGSPGINQYTAIIEPADDERNRANNRMNFVVNVLENKQKILILSNGPHPDNGTIKNTLEQQKSYDVSIFTEEPYPSNLSDFNLVILNQLPNQRISMGSIIGEEQNRRIPLLLLVGPKTFLPQLNALDLGVETEQLAGSPEEAQAHVNPSYSTFTVSDEFREIIPRFPPLLAPYSQFDLASEMTSLLYQKIKNVETAKPLVATGVINGRKTGFIFGEGLWRWRLFNYYLNQTHAQSAELINQLVQYLALRENEDNFIIDYQPVYAEIDDVILNAEVYNDAFERITSEEVTIEITNEQGEEFPFTFDIRGDEYTLNAGKLPVGNYNFSSSVTIGDETYSEKGGFSVTAVQMEKIITRANHKMLYQLANQSGGDFFLPGETQQLLQQLKTGNQLKPVVYFQDMVNELLNLRWLFFVFLLILSMEWFLRKYWGMY